MKYFKYFILTIFIFSIVLVSCKKSVTEPEEKTIVGKWSFSSAKLKRIITTNSNQTVKLPFSGIGSIKIKGAVTSLLNGLVIEKYEPFTIGVYRIEYEGYLSAVLYIDDDSNVATYYSGITDKTYKGTIDYSFDGDKLVIEESTITNQDDVNDTLDASGEISFETIGAIANNPVDIEVPAFQTQYQRGYMVYEFLDDGTFVRTMNNNDGQVIDTGNWESSGSTITTTINGNNYTDVRVIEYSIDGNILTGIELYNLCESSQDSSLCLSSHEEYFQIADGSLAKVMMESTLHFRQVNEIN